jgi:endonuclease/exonuclease/phosphatase family metal-dependent hydrolase
MRMRAPSRSRLAAGTVIHARVRGFRTGAAIAVSLASILLRLNTVRLRVATLNVWAVPLFSERIGARMREIGRRLTGLELDAIAFQEVWTPAARRTLIEAGRKVGLGNAWHRRRLLVGSGLLVLSRLPFAEVDFRRFSLRGGASDKDELLGGKGLAEIVLRTPAGPLALLDTHLHAGTARKDPLGARALRTAQIVELASRVRARSEAVLVMGDLNCQDGEPEYEVLRELTSLRDLAAENGNRMPTALRANPYRLRSPKGDRRIDYILARDGEQLGVRPVSVERVFDEPFSIDGREAACSDHAGVLAELELAPAPPPDRALANAAALDLASRLLGEGRRVARRDRRTNRAEAGIGLAAAALAVTGSRARPFSRRTLLRGALSLGALVALAPALESSLSSEWLARSEIDALRTADALLAEMRAELYRSSS